jgi:hypothetical protein
MGAEQRYGDDKWLCVCDKCGRKIGTLSPVSVSPNGEREYGGHETIKQAARAARSAGWLVFAGRKQERGETVVDLDVVASALCEVCRHYAEPRCGVGRDYLETHLHNQAVRERRISGREYAVRGSLQQRTTSSGGVEYFVDHSGAGQPWDIHEPS